MFCLSLNCISSGGQQTGADPRAVAAWLHDQDGAAGAAAPHDPQGEHEAVAAAWGQQLLVPHSVSTTQSTLKFNIF